MGWRTDRERGAPSHLAKNPIVDAKIHHWDHVGLAMRDPRRAIELFRDVFGGQFVVGGDNLQIGIRSMVFKLPTKVKVEFLSPLYPDSYLAKYLDEHGEGFHHATLFVDDIASTIKDLEATASRLSTRNLMIRTGWKHFCDPNQHSGALSRWCRAILTGMNRIQFALLRQCWLVSGDGGERKCGTSRHYLRTTPKNACADFSPKREPTRG